MNRLFDSELLNNDLRYIRDALKGVGATDIVRQRNAMSDRILFKYGGHVYGLYLSMIGQAHEVQGTSITLRTIVLGKIRMVHSGLSTFEREFICYIMTPDGERSLYDDFAMSARTTYVWWDQENPSAPPYRTLPNQITEGSIE